MAFYRPEQGMQGHLAGLIDRLANDGRPGLHDQISVTWVRYDDSSPTSGSGMGAGWADQRQRYPASVVKLIYAVAAEHWLQRDLIPDSEELRRALLDMLADSSNDATGLIVDLLTGTTSGPTLRSPFREQWEQQRLVVNDWLQTFGWADFTSGFWLGGCGGAVFAWFLCNTVHVQDLFKIAAGVWSVG